MFGHPYTNPADRDNFEKRAVAKALEREYLFSRQQETPQVFGADVPKVSNVQERMARLVSRLRRVSDAVASIEGGPSVNQAEQKAPNLPGIGESLGNAEQLADELSKRTAMLRDSLGRL